MAEPAYIAVAQALQSPDAVLLVYHDKCSGEEPVAYSPFAEGFPPWGFTCPVCGERPRRWGPSGWDDELTYSFALGETCRGLPIVPREAIFPMNKPLSYEDTMEPKTGSDATTPIDEWIAGYCGALNNARRHPGATLLQLLELAGIDPHDIPEGIDDDQDAIRRTALADLNEED